MTKLLFSVFAAIFMLVMFSNEAAARRVRIPILIPGASESLVKVLEFPNIPALKRKDGKYIDLGYKFNKYSGGEWIGYIGSSTKFLTLNKAQLTMLLSIAGVDKLPPVPSRAASSGSSWGFGLGFLAILGFFIMGKRILVGTARLFGRRGKAEQPARKYREPVEEQPDFANFDDAIAARLEARETQSAMPQRPSTFANPAASNAGFGQRTPAASFGQRV